jgi:hypothetical protein
MASDGESDIDRKTRVFVQNVRLFSQNCRLFNQKRAAFQRPDASVTIPAFAMYLTEAFSDEA